MKAVLAERVKKMFSSPTETKELISAIKKLDEKKTKIKVKIDEKEVLVLEIR